MDKIDSKNTQDFFFSLWSNFYEDSFGKLVTMPTLGPKREESEKLMKGFSTFVNFYTALMKSNANFQSVFMKAMGNMSDKTISEMDKDPSPDKYRSFYKIWIETYSGTFNEFLKSELFSSENGKLMSAFMDFQKHSKDIFEENYLKPMNLPTKTDIDEINKELYILRKTVKELTKQIKELSEKNNSTAVTPLE